MIMNIDYYDKGSLASVQKYVHSKISISSQKYGKNNRFFWKEVYLIIHSNKSFIQHCKRKEEQQLKIYEKLYEKLIKRTKYQQYRQSFSTTNI